MTWSSPNGVLAIAFARNLSMAHSHDAGLVRKSIGDISTIVAPVHSAIPIHVPISPKSW